MDNSLNDNSNQISRLNPKSILYYSTLKYKNSTPLAVEKIIKMKKT